MSTREANRTKKWLNCLRCGRKLFTDRCHRICPKCHQKNEQEGHIRLVETAVIRRKVYDDWMVPEFQVADS